MQGNAESTQENTPLSKRLRLVEMGTTSFRTKEGHETNLMEATPQEFDDFLSMYVKVEEVDRSVWPLIIRWRAVNFALSHGQPVDIFTTSKRQKIDIFSVDETAQEAHS